MSVLFFLVSALCLVYINANSTVTTIVVVLFTLLGMHLDDWSLLSIIFGGLFLSAAYVLVFATSLRQNVLSGPLLNWVR